MGCPSPKKLTTGIHSSFGQGSACLSKKKNSNFQFNACVGPRLQSKLSACFLASCLNQSVERRGARKARLSLFNLDGTGEKRFSQQSLKIILESEVSSGAASCHHAVEVQNGKIIAAAALQCCICWITRLMSKQGGCTQLQSLGTQNVRLSIKKELASLKFIHQLKEGTLRAFGMPTPRSRRQGSKFIVIELAITRLPSPTLRQLGHGIPYQCLLSCTSGLFRWQGLLFYWV